MNGAFQHADTPEERLGIAVVTANEAYDKAHPQGIRPGYGFYAHFLGPFLRREVLLELQEWRRKGVRLDAAVERDIAQELMELNHEIEDRLHGRE